MANAPSGDGHDDARDLGQLEVYNDDDFLYFTIEHKYLYGAWQGDYQHLYIAMDTDGEFGSGSTRLPDGIGGRISAGNAWEYCAYLCGQEKFGLYIGEGYKQERPVTLDGRKMEVTVGTGANAKAIIKIPLALIGNPQNIHFAVISAKPSAGGGGVCDVLPGDRLAVEGGLISNGHDISIAVTKVTYVTTVKTNYNLYDDGGQVLCDLDSMGNITKKYVYAPSTGLGAGSGKHVAMELPGNKDYMVNGGFEYRNYEYPLTPWNKWAPYALPAVNWQIVSDVKRTGTYSLKAGPFVYSDPIDASTNTFENYAQNVSLPALPFIASCYMKAQDLTGGVYLIVECWTAGYGTPLWNKYSNLRLGTNDSWELLSLVVTDLPPNTGAIKVTLQRLNGTGTVWVDDVRCEEGVSRKEDKTYYYHCDYLGSPRVMTDPLGNVIWRQDYYAFGGDYNTSATGNTHKFTGHVKDDATGQYYAKARYFTTSNGRWSQPEPLLKGVPEDNYLYKPQKLNPYIYCDNNPTKYVDADGNEPVEGALLASAGLYILGFATVAAVEHAILYNTNTEYRDAVNSTSKTIGDVVSGAVEQAVQNIGNIVANVTTTDQPQSTTLETSRSIPQKGPKVESVPGREKAKMKNELNKNSPKQERDPEKNPPPNPAPTKQQQLKREPWWGKIIRVITGEDLP